MKIRYAILLLGALVASTLLCAGSARADDGAAEKHYIAGTVSDTNGNPISDVVVALGPIPSLFEREARSLSQTDQDGAFKLEVNYPGQTTVSCWHAAHVGTTVDASTEEDVHIVLPFGEDVDLLIDCPEVFHPQMTASIFYPETGYQEYKRSDGGGHFNFSGLPIGRCVVEVRGRDARGNRHFSLTKSTVIRSGLGVSIVKSLPEGQSAVEGTVVDDAGLALRATVTLHLEPDGLTLTESTQTGTDGRFSFAPVPKGQGQIVVSAVGNASALVPVRLGPDGVENLPPIALGPGLPLRCSFLSAPEGTEAIQIHVFFGKLEHPGTELSEVRALLGAPVAWSGSVRQKNVRVEDLLPGQYTILAYPVPSASRELDVFETAELLRYAPVYMDSFTINEGSAGAVIAATFPHGTRATLAPEYQPVHPIIGRWTYRHQGSIWVRTFTQDGRCILTEGPVTAWVHPYVILGDRRVAVITDGVRRIHTVRPDGKLDVEGQFVGSRQ